MAPMDRTRKTRAQLMAELEELRREVNLHIRGEDDATRAEEAMWETQIGLLALFNNLPGMAYRTAVDPTTPSGLHVEFVSAGCLKQTGYAAE
ncbi:MAG: hypothetical protein JXR77_06840, partial [Lentisphaeria bacterium]|nr:hypothetical protein [Lentisphaeria bacterium]